MLALGVALICADISFLSLYIISKMYSILEVNSNKAHFGMSSMTFHDSFTVCFLSGNHYLKAVNMCKHVDSIKSVYDI